MNEARDAHETLMAEWKNFQNRWQDSKAAWKDKIAVDFEQRFFAPLQADVPPFLRALESLDDELKAAKREVGR